MISSFVNCKFNHSIQQEQQQRKQFNHPEDNNYQDLISFVSNKRIHHLYNHPTTLPYQTDQSTENV